MCHSYRDEGVCEYCLPNILQTVWIWEHKIFFCSIWIRENLFSSCLIPFNSEFHLYVQIARQKNVFSQVAPCHLSSAFSPSSTCFSTHLNCLMEKRNPALFVLIFCELWQTQASWRSCRQVKLTASYSRLSVCCKDQLPPGLAYVVTLVALAIKDAQASGVVEERSFLSMQQGWHIERLVFS